MHSHKKKKEKKTQNQRKKMRVWSIDVGVRNLGFAVMDVDFAHLHQQPQQQDSGGGGGGSGTCRIDEVCTLHKVGVIVAASKEECASDAPFVSVVPFMQRALMRVARETGNVWPRVLVIEEQNAQLATRNNELQAFIEGFLSGKLHDHMLHIFSFPPSVKFSGTVHQSYVSFATDTPGVSAVPQNNKKVAVEMACFWAPAFLSTTSAVSGGGGRGGDDVAVVDGHWPIQPKKTEKEEEEGVHYTRRILPFLRHWLGDTRVLVEASKLDDMCDAFVQLFQFVVAAALHPAFLRRSKQQPLGGSDADGGCALCTDKTNARPNGKEETEKEEEMMVPKTTTTLLHARHFGGGGICVPLCATTLGQEHARRAEVAIRKRKREEEKKKKRQRSGSNKSHASSSSSSTSFNKRRRRVLAI